MPHVCGTCNCRLPRRLAIDLGLTPLAWSGRDVLIGLYAQGLAAFNEHRLVAEPFEHAGDSVKASLCQEFLCLVEDARFILVGHAMVLIECANPKRTVRDPISQVIARRWGLLASGSLPLPMSEIAHQHFVNSDIYKRNDVLTSNRRSMHTMRFEKRWLL